MYKKGEGKRRKTKRESKAGTREQYKEGEGGVGPNTGEEALYYAEDEWSGAKITL